MPCQRHAVSTQPSRGWAGLDGTERDYKLNILALHDDFQAQNTVFTDALSRVGLSPAGLYASATSGKPVLCASCHASNALGTTGQPGVASLTTAVHRKHANVVDPVTDMTLDFAQNRSACYRCHPGSETRCLRGKMGAAVAADGSLAIQCQSCHGGMSAVGADREGWLDEPTCQACHTGTATSNNGEIRYTDARTASGALRVAVNDRFATNPNTPAAGFSLYRFSSGHGGLQCEACHGSTHAIYASSHANDNVQSISLQGHAGTVSECTSCHASMPRTTTGGPHGMHPVGQDWVRSHGDAAEHNTSGCAECHGADLRGTVLSRAFADRTLSAFGTHQLWQGFQVGCYLCHQGPNSERATSNRAPVASNQSASTSTEAAKTLSLTATDPDGNPLRLRIVSQPANGTVALNGSTAVYRPSSGFEGTDAFTWAANDGSTDSNLATASVTVTASNRPAFTAEGVVNAASFRGGGVAPGEMATIFGTGLGPSALTLLQINSAGLVARSLAGVRVLFDGHPAPLIYVSGTQLTAMVPYAVGGAASTSVQVEYNGIRSAPVTLPVRSSSPGLFSQTMNGTGQAAILNQDGVTVNSADAPASRGSVVSVFATGEGMIDLDWVDGQVASTLAHPQLPVTATIGGVDAPVRYVGSAPSMVTGFLQVNLEVPQGVTPGDAVPLVVKIGSEESQAGATMAVR
ncbi:MAG: Ig-like domain-containing protein [Bryobacterales bacterium]